MADGEDNKENMQKKDDAQVKNDLSAIKAQVTATNNPAELARLASAAANLASSTNNPEILEQIKNLQSTILKKEEIAEQAVSSQINAENMQAQEQGEQANKIEAMHEQELHKRHERIMAGHSQFMKEADEFIEEKKKRNENLQSILDDIKAGKEISPERMQSVIRTPEQIKEDLEKEKALKNYLKKAGEHLQQLKAKEEKLKKLQALDIKAAEEQRNSNSKLVPNSQELEQGQHKLKVIDTRIQQREAKINDLKPKIEAATKVEAEAIKQVEENKKLNKIIETTKEKIKEEIDKQKKKNPEKYNAKLDDFSTLLLNETKAAETGEIKDHELRNNFLGRENKLEIPAKTPEEIPTKSSQETPVKSPQEIQPIAPNIKREELPTQAQSKQENVFEKITCSIGDKLSELKEKYDFNVPKEEVANAQKEVRNGLENQKNLPVKTKSNEAYKQLSRTNQQTKKNDGYTR